MKMPWEIAGSAPSWKPDDPPIGVSKRKRIRARLMLKRARGRLCPYCERPMTLANGRHAPQSPTRDHKVPSSRGGSNSLDNIEPCCRRCNEDKGSLTPDEYRAVLAGLASRLDRMTPERRRWRKGITPAFDRAQAAGY